MEKPMPINRKEAISFFLRHPYTHGGIYKLRIVEFDNTTTQINFVTVTDFHTIFKVI